MLSISAILRFMRIPFVSNKRIERFPTRPGVTALGAALVAVVAVTSGKAFAQTQIATTAMLSVTSGGAAVTSVASGAVVTLTATVSAGSVPVAPGQVNFCDASATACRDAHLLGTAQLTAAGTATLKFRPGIGSHSYKALFLGTKKFSGGASSASALVVTGTIGTLASTTTIARSGTWGTYALSTTVTESGNTVLPTGNVAFVDSSYGNSVLQTIPLGSGAQGIDWPNPQGLPTTTGSQAVAVGDFNGDGIPDVVAVAGGTFRPLLIFLGNPNGTYTAAPSPAFSAYTFGPVIVADFNGDGKQDLAVLNGDTDTVTIFLGNGDGTFNLAASSPATGSNANQIAVGDFNGDGLPDLAVTTDATNTVNILLGNGDGTFTSAPNNPVLGHDPFYLAVADLNGDGKVDLAITDVYDDTAWILLGNGDGTFAASGNLHSGIRDSPIAVGDFNGDGKPDLAVGASGGVGGTDSVTVLPGNGDGTFTSPSPVPPVSSSLLSSIAAGDFNGDGIPDLVVTDSDTGAFSVFLNNGSSSFTTFSATTESSPYYSFASAVADVNGDGRSDLVVGNFYADSVDVYLTEPTETVTSTANLGLMGVGQHLVKASYSGDSNYASSVSGNTPLWGQQPATSTSLTLTSGGAQVTTVAPGSGVTLTATVSAGAQPVTAGSVNFCDASATNCTDIHLLGSAALNSSGTATFRFVPGSGLHSYKAEFVEDGYGLGSSSPVLTLTVGPAVIPVYSDTITITGAGFPGNYSLEATVLGYGGSSAPTGNVSFLDTSFANTVLATAPLGPGTAGQGWLISQTPAASATPIAEATGDFNGDGIPDLAVAFENSSFNANVTIFLGKGDGTFTTGPTTQTQVPVDYASVRMIAGDFNGDGKADLALLGYSDVSQTDGVVTLFGNGDGTFTQSKSSTVFNQGPVGGDFIQGSMVAADFNGDGKMDLAVVGDYVNSGGVTIVLGNGDGTFQPVTPNFATSQGFNVVATGDFNGDGVPDVIAVDYFNPGGATVLLGNGDGTLTAVAATLPTGTFAQSIVVGDFNGDGKLDLAFGYSSGVLVFLGNGDGTFYQAPGSPVTGGGTSLVAGDFNHDGKLDLAGLSGPQVDLFLGNGDGTFTETTATPSLSGISLALYAAIVPADFNGDGTTDLALAAAGQDTASILLAVPTQTATATVTGIAPVGTQTHNVEASYPGDSNYPSSVSGTVALMPGLAPLVLSPTSGSYSTAQTLTISESIPDAAIYYSATGPISTNGFVPYTGPIQITSDGVESVQAYATETGYQQTEYASATYTLSLPTAATPVFSVAPGVFYSPQTVAISDSVAGATIYYTTDGSQPTSASAVYSVPLSVSSTETLEAIAVATGYTESSVASAAYTISQPTAPVIAWSTPAPIAYGTPLSSAQLNATTSVAGSFVYSPGAGTVLKVGQQTLKTTFTPTSTAEYTTSTAAVTLTVNLATPALSAVGSSMNPSFASSQITFTASVTSPAGTPSGSLVFFDGSTQLGSAALSTGSASFATSTLAAGSHAITAVYSGDANFATLTSAVLTQIVESYTITAPSGGSSSATVSPGGQANFVLGVTPPGVGAPLTFAVTGLPPGATATFSPSSIPAGSATTNVTMTVSVPNTAEVRPLQSPFRHEDAPVLFGLLLLPFAGKLRKKPQRWLGLFLLAMVGLMTAAGVSGCSSGGGSGGGSAPTPHVYTLTVTAASGSLTQSTTVTLTVD